MFTKNLKESIDLKSKIIQETNLEVLSSFGDQIINSIKSGGKLLVCGNGGSAADAQHLVAELLVRLRPKYNRQSIPALTLAQDISTITACSNDFGYDHIYERTLRGLGNSKDTLLVITTSGNSENINLVLKAAKEMGIKSFAFLGSSGGKAIDLCDEYFLVPSNITARIQEVHITIGHALMEYVEDGLLESGHIELNKV